jgi:hypothetical protein
MSAYGIVPGFPTQKDEDHGHILGNLQWCVFPRRCLTTNPTMNEEYYRQKVLLHVHWGDELDVKGMFFQLVQY